LLIVFFIACPVGSENETSKVDANWV
jgi:hypothetical protein